MGLKKSKAFEFKPFSKRQKQILTWWIEGSPYADYDMIIADGSIRSGKTVAMIDSFMMWSLSTFTHQSFIIAARSAGALKRNILQPMFQILTAKGIGYSYNRSENYVIVGNNTYYCFGAANEASQDVMQGLTAAGAYADEAALFPQSFIEQMIARCSIEHSKIWMNCNPESPYHFIKTDFIDKAEEKYILHLHFTLNDNLSLTESIKSRYKRMYTGLWFKRMILGLWVMADGIIYDMFGEENLYNDESRPTDLYSQSTRYITIDYGTTNPMVFLDIYDDGTTLWADKEYYYDSKVKHVQKTDGQYMEDLKEFLDGEYPTAIIIDPSAASFKVLLQKNGYRVLNAKNDVNDGIRVVSTMLNRKFIRVHENCTNMRTEFSSYMWDEKAAQNQGKEQPLKQKDHSMDALRYLVNTIIKKWRLIA